MCVIRLVSVLMLAMLGNSAHAQFRLEVLNVPSALLSDEQFLNGQRDGKAIMLAGTLRLPKPGRLPAVLLVHGSGGIGQYVTDWEPELNAMGFATFVLDSWSGRGITSTVLDQSLAGRLAQLYDAYRALEVLEKHPRVDPERIAIMGFSRGGQATVYAAMKRFQRMHGSASGREFAAYIALYPTCNTVYRDDDAVSSRPMRIFHGSADDYVPVAPCRDYARRLKAKGADIQHTEYAGAHHVYDGQTFKTPVRIEKGQTTRKCQMEEAQPGRIVNVSDRQLFTLKDPCVEYGVTIAYDETAATQTRKAVKSFLGEVLRP